MPFGALSAFSMCGSRWPTAAFIASADCSTSATIISLAPKRRPTSSMPAISGPLMISSGRARLQRLVEVGEQARPSSLRGCSAPGARRAAGRGAPRPSAFGALARKCAAKAAIGSSPRHQIRSSASRRSSSGIDGVALELLGVDDRHVEAGLHAVVEEDRVEHLAAGRRQAERDVRDAEDRLALAAAPA